MPGFTHLQVRSRSPSVTPAGLFRMLARDAERMIDCRRRVNRLPLGPLRWPAPAIRSTAFRRRQLGFEAVCENSLDAVSDRDFAIEFRRRGAGDDAPVALSEELICG